VVTQLSPTAADSVGVTAPRCLLPGETYLITRRCTQRQFLLRPSRLTNQLVSYCLALAAQHTGVLLHAVCFMSNHWHGVVSDPFARLPEFLERFHRMFARAQNAALGRWENLWSSDKTSVVLLVSEQDILDKMAYTMANPTAAGLVATPSQWPGVITRRMGEQLRIEMPDVFFDHDGILPPQAELEFTRPPAFSHLDDGAFARLLDDAVRERVRAAREHMRQQGKPFLGAKDILRQAFSAAPTTPAPRRNPNPRIAAHRTPERVNAIRRMLEFVHDYREAFLAWRNGDRSVLFPAGTYALRIQARVACMPAMPA
jgi:putative transposase